MPSRQPNVTGRELNLLNPLARNYSQIPEDSPFRWLPTSRNSPSAESMKFKNLDMFLHVVTCMYVCPR